MLPPNYPTVRIMAPVGDPLDDCRVPSVICVTGASVWLPENASGEFDIFIGSGATVQVTCCEHSLGSVTYSLRVKRNQDN